MLEAFVGPRPEGCEASHYPDRDRSNRKLTNLRWETHKQDAAEGRTPHDRDDAIEGAVEEIAAVNKRRKAGGWYLGEGELREALEEVWGRSVRRAAREVYSGRYPAVDLGASVDRGTILAEALRLIKEGGES